MRKSVKAMAAEAAVNVALKTGIAERKASSEEQQMIAMTVMRKSEIIYENELELRRTGNGKGLIYDPMAEDYHSKSDPGKPIGFVVIKDGIGAGWINGKFDDFEKRPDNPYPDTEFAEVDASHYKEYDEMLARQEKQESVIQETTTRKYDGPVGQYMASDDMESESMSDDYGY